MACAITVEPPTAHDKGIFYQPTDITCLCPQIQNWVLRVLFFLQCRKKPPDLGVLGGSRSSICERGRNPYNLVNEQISKGGSREGQGGKATLSLCAPRPPSYVELFCSELNQRISSSDPAPTEKERNGNCLDASSESREPNHGGGSVKGEARNYHLAQRFHP